MLPTAPPPTARYIAQQRGVESENIVRAIAAQRPVHPRRKTKKGPKFAPAKAEKASHSKRSTKRSTIAPVPADAAHNLGATCLYQCCVPCATYFPPGVAAAPTAIPTSNCCMWPTCCPYWSCGPCSCFFANCGNPCSCVCCGGPQPVVLVDPNPEIDEFGSSGYGMAVSSRHFAVAAEGRGRRGDGKGAVYIYDKKGENMVTISAPAGVYYFGANLAMNDQIVAIGATDEVDRFGRVFLYNLDGTGMQEVPRPAAALDMDSFGEYGMALTNTHMVIANPYEGEESATTESPGYGAAYLYVLDRNSATRPGEPVRFTSANTPHGGGSEFGFSLGLSSTHVALGSYYMTYPATGDEQFSSVYMFSLHEPPSAGPVGEVRDTDDSEFAYYPNMVRLTDSTLAVAAPEASREPDDDRGAIQLFEAWRVRGSQPVPPSAVLWGDEPGDELGYYGIGLNDKMLSAFYPELYIWNRDGSNRAIIPQPPAADPSDWGEYHNLGKAGLIVLGAEISTRVDPPVPARVFLYSPTA